MNEQILKIAQQHSFYSWEQTDLKQIIGRFSQFCEYSLPINQLFEPIGASFDLWAEISDGTKQENQRI